MNDTKKILIATAMFVLMSTGAGASTQSDISFINAQICHARRHIEQLRARRADSEKCRVSARLSECVREREMLCAKNDSILSAACDIARKMKRMSVVAKSTMVFMTYSHDARICRLHDYYDTNMRRIHDLDRKIERMRNWLRNTGFSADSAMYREIDRYQLMIDSLLNEKMKRVH